MEYSQVGKVPKRFIFIPRIHTNQGGLSMKVKGLFILIAIAAVFLLGACSENDASKDVEVDEDALKNINETGMPIVKEPISLDVFVPVDPIGFKQWDDILVWNKYADMTNIDVKWDKIQAGSLEEKRNLVLASGELPDAFYAAGIPILDLFKYGKQGTFIKLNDLIDKHAPNLSKVMEEYPEVKKAMTFPDGNIYALPTIISPESLSLRIGARPWINKGWLENLDMDMPETTETFYQYLKAVKEGDPNGNGENDEVPFGGINIDVLINWLKGSFGLANKGPENKYIDIDPESKDMRFFPIAEENKEMLQYIHKLYDEKLIEQNIFSIEGMQFKANGTDGLYGSTVYYDPEIIFGEGGKDFVGGLALEGPNGDKTYTSIGQLVTQIGAFAITSENKYPVASVKWLDYFYSDEGSKFYFMGEEGKTYEESPDGEFEYMDKITDSTDGLTLEQELAKYVPYVSVYAPAMFKEKFFQGSESSPASIKSAEKLEPYFPEEIWPAFTYTENENKTLAALEADIGKYVEEMRDKFITGDIPFSEWDSYTETIKKMGLNDYMKIQKAAYERYLDN